MTEKDHLDELLNNVRDKETIERQADIIHKLVEAVRQIALMDEVDAALDPTWSILRANAAWLEARQALFHPKPKDTSP